MGYWGKIIGGMAGFAMGGPLGAMVGATLGHAADTGAATKMRLPFGGPNPAQLAAMLGQRDQLFAIGVVVLSAKLAKCDGPVTRAEIDAFKRHFRIPPEHMRDVGRLFDQARDASDGFEAYADQLGQAFADTRGTLTDVLTDVLSALFAIARADGPLNKAELAYLSRVHDAFGLDQKAWDLARGATQRQPVSSAPDPYGVLGLSRTASNEDIRATWKRLVRENHPDSLASRGVTADFVARATAKVAEINAAWDSIKRERHL
jgi:DnaJ like chaperone protein